MKSCIYRPLEMFRIQNPGPKMRKLICQKMYFTILGPKFGILAIPRGQYIELDMRNPIFRSEMINFGIQRSKIRKNYLRKKFEILKSQISLNIQEFPWVPGVEPILLDLENPFLPSRDLKNGRKTQKLEVKIFKNFEKISPKISYQPFFGTNQK